jgi:hypothetical protein
VRVGQLTPDLFAPTMATDLATVNDAGSRSGLSRVAGHLLAGVETRTWRSTTTLPQSPIRRRGTLLRFASPNALAASPSAIASSPLVAVSCSTTRYGRELALAEETGATFAAAFARLRLADAARLAIPTRQSLWGARWSLSNDSCRGVETARRPTNLCGACFMQVDLESARGGARSVATGTAAWHGGFRARLRGVAGDPTGTAR